MSYLYNHYTDSSLTVAQIAAACNYSESHISHVFSQRMHMNLRTYIKQLRINVAKGMLKHGAAYRQPHTQAALTTPTISAPFSMPWWA